MTDKKQAGNFSFASLFLFILSGCVFSLREIPQPLLEHRQVSLKSIYLSPHTYFNFYKR